MTNVPESKLALSFWPHAAIHADKVVKVDKDVFLTILGSKIRHVKVKSARVLFPGMT